LQKTNSVPMLTISITLIGRKFEVDHSFCHISRNPRSTQNGRFKLILTICIPLIS
jgi:hypothetical protein